jgi:competence protein ComEC
MQRVRDIVLYSIIGGFVGGIVFASVIGTSITFLLFALLLAGALMVEGFVRHTHAGVSMSILAALVLASAVLGSMRLEASRTRAGDPVLSRGLGLEEEVHLEGRIVDEPEERGMLQHVVVEVDTLVEVDARHALASTGVLLILDRHAVLAYGDRIAIVGTLTLPEVFETESGRTFDYQSYLAKDGIYYQMFRPEVEQVARRQGSIVKHALFDLKHAFLRGLESVLREPHGALAAGLIVGTKQSLGEKLLDQFRAAGLVHMIVLSGFNLAIVASAIGRVATFVVRRNAAIILSAVGIVAFAILVGGGATVVRASVMALVALLARALGRPFDAARALAFAGAMMLLHNPLILFHDPSFQLSFLATLSLVVLAPLLEQRFAWITERFGIREIIVATITTQLFVLPLLLYETGTLSLWSLPANVLVLPLVPPTMFFAALAGGVAMLTTSLAFPFAFVADLLLSYELLVVRLVAALPFAHLTLPAFPAWALGLAYAALGFVLYSLKDRIGARRAVGQSASI